MLSLRKLFFDPAPPTEEQLTRGRRCLIAEGAVAGVLYSIGTGNFMTGYLGQMGASVSFCALMAMIPQAGCILQFFSPLLFERLHHRKLAIWSLCVVFRFSLSLTFLLPARMGPQAEGMAFVLYTLAFAAAGAVTPGLQHMTIGLAPPEARGRFFAAKDIAANCVNSGCTLVLGRLLDAWIAAGHAAAGYSAVGAVCLALAALDAALLAATRENPVAFTSRMRLREVLHPLRDATFRPMLLYSVLGGAFGGFATPVFDGLPDAGARAQPYFPDHGRGGIGSGRHGRQLAAGPLGRPHQLAAGDPRGGRLQPFLHAGLGAGSAGLGALAGAGAHGGFRRLCRRGRHRQPQPAVCLQPAQRQNGLHRHHGGAGQYGGLRFGGCRHGSAAPACAAAGQRFDPGAVRPRRRRRLCEPCRQRPPSSGGAVITRV